MNDIIVSKQELFIMLCSSVRYALGRRSYIVGETCDLVRKYYGKLDVNARSVVLRNISEVVERPGALVGMQMDHDEWVRLLADIRATV